jgi:hypothetical protein
MSDGSSDIASEVGTSPDMSIETFVLAPAGADR